MKRSEGTLQKLRLQLPWPPGKPFRILSIDGGGILGILPAKVLATFEKRLLNGDCIGNYFDLIAGTSTGAIIALALAVGIPAARILDVYIEHGEEVFPSPRLPFGNISRRLRMFWDLGHYRYRREPLEKHLRAVFSDRTLGHAERRLCIPTFDDYTEVNIFKTPHHPDFTRDWHETLVTAALASAAAPTFFPVYREKGRHFADGGVWAADPSMIALVDALSCHDLNRRDIHLVSLGCGDVEMRMTEGQIEGGGMWHWREIIQAAMHLQGQNALGQAGLLIGRDQLIRINAPVNAGNSIAMDDYRRARAELPQIGEALAIQVEEIVRASFLQDPAEKYRAYYGPRSADRVTTDSAKG